MASTVNEMHQQEGHTRHCCIHINRRHTPICAPLHITSISSTTGPNSIVSSAHKHGSSWCTCQCTADAACTENNGMSAQKRETSAIYRFDKACCACDHILITPARIAACQRFAPVRSHQPGVYLNKTLQAPWYQPAKRQAIANNFKACGKSSPTVQTCMLQEHTAQLHRTNMLQGQRGMVTCSARLQTRTHTPVHTTIHEKQHNVHS